MNFSVGNSRKRKRGEKIFKFETFCAKNEELAQFLHHESFQENIKGFVELGHLEESNNVEGFSWSFQLQLETNSHICSRLFVIEENVDFSHNRNCRYCRSVGWGHHLICKKRYHFIVLSKETSIDVEILKKNIGNSLSTQVLNCGNQKIATTGSKRHQHLLHGVVHSNGYGHLLAINGIEAGSRFISGQQILSLWDRICFALKVRKVSLIDEARKGPMELRLVNGIAYGEPWFGKWGYKFGHPSYGIRQEIYVKSLQALQSLPLNVLLPHFRYAYPKMQLIVSKYQMLCGNAIQTLGNLFQVMLELKARLPPFATMAAMDFRGLVGEAPCRWSIKRVEMAAQVIIAELKKLESKWISRQDIRDAARTYIGDTGLLDYVLKSLGNHVIGSYIIRRVVNPVTKVLEYCLEDTAGRYMNHNIPTATFGTRLQVVKDMVYLYRHILMEPKTTNNGLYSGVSMAVRNVLDTKHLIKDYFSTGAGVRSSLISELPGVIEGYMKLPCTIGIKDDRGNEILHKELPPCEYITVPNYVSFGELKTIAERHYREMYYGLKSFIAETVNGVNGTDSDHVFGHIGPETIVVIGGIVTDQTDEICEGGRVVVVVDCACGATDEDGERMVQCDVCEVMQHTRCVGIPDAGEVPNIYLCSQCDNNIIAFQSIDQY